MYNRLCGNQIHNAPLLLSACRGLDLQKALTKMDSIEYHL